MKKIQVFLDNVHNAIESITKPKEEDAPAVENVQDINRTHGEQIRSTLSAIEFHKNRIHNAEDPDFLEKMQRQRDNLIVRLTKMPTISDDISQIDAILQFAADAWKSAVVEGYYNKAKWAIAGLTKGIKECRTDIPADHMDKVQEVLDNRQEMMKVYFHLIMHSESMDIAAVNITNFNIDLKRDLDLIAPIKQEIREARNDPQKLTMVANVRAYLTGLKKIEDLSDEEQKLLDNYMRGINLLKSIRLTRSQIAEQKVKLNSAESMHATYRNKLTIKDLNDQKQLIAEHKLALDAIVKETEETLAYADRVRQDIVAFQAELDAVWDGTASQNLNRQTLEFVDNVLFEGNRNEALGTDMAIELKKNLNEQKEENTARTEELNALFQTAENVNTDENANENQNQNINYNY